MIDALVPCGRLNFTGLVHEGDVEDFAFPSGFGPSTDGRLLSNERLYSPLVVIRAGASIGYTCL